MVKSKLPPGTDVEVTVFARGAPEEKSNPWIGENSSAARKAAGDRLAKEIDTVPANEAVIIVGHSHADTVATIGANESRRGVDLKISFNAPGIEQPQSGKITAAINFNNPNDNVASHAGASDLLKHGTSGSPNRVTNPGGYVANIETGQLPITDSAGHVINPPTIAGVGEHSYNLDPRIIDQEISPKLGQGLKGFAPSAGNRTDPGTSRAGGTGDLLIEAGNAYGAHPASRVPEANHLTKTLDPFAFQNQETSDVVRPSSTPVRGERGIFPPKETSKRTQKPPTKEQSQGSVVDLTPISPPPSPGRTGIAMANSQVEDIEAEYKSAVQSLWDYYLREFDKLSKEADKLSLAEYIKRSNKLKSNRDEGLIAARQKADYKRGLIK